MKKFISIILSVLMLLTIGIVNTSAEGDVAKIVDVGYETIDAAVAAAKAGDEIDIFVAGTYKIPAIAKNITIKASVDGVEFDCKGSGSIASFPNGATFDNVKMTFGNTGYHGFQHAGFIIMKNCTLNGFFLSYGNMQFDNCIFEQNTKEYNMWAYGNDLTFNDCTFNSCGKFINVYCESNAETYNIVCNRCTFNSSETNKSALNVKETCGANLLKYYVELNNCTTNDNFPIDKCGNSKLWMVDDRTEDGTTALLVKVDGKQVYPFIQARIDDKDYQTLNDAVKDAEDNQTITLLEDVIDGSGIFVKDKNITIDLNGKSYTVTKDLVGSNGTENQAFHFEKDANVTLKNGTIFVNNTNAKFIIQNYGDLTIEDVVIEQEFENQNKVKYCISNNCGEVNIIGNSVILADDGVVAVECSWWPSAYGDGSQVNINTSGLIEGDIELGLYGTGSSIEHDNKSKITINNAKFDGQIKTTNATGEYGTGLQANEEKEVFSSMLEVKGGVFKNTSVKNYLDDGKTLVANTDSKTNTYYPYMIGEKQIEVDVDINADTDSSEVKKAADVKNIVESDIQSMAKSDANLVAEAISLANNKNIINNETVQNALTKVNDIASVAIEESDLKLKVQTYLDMNITDTKSNNDVSEKLDSVTIDITPMFKVVAYGGSVGEDDAVTVESGKKMSSEGVNVSGTVKCIVYLPESFGEENERVYIKHKGHVYGLTEEDKIVIKLDENLVKYVEFANPDGFSPFQFSLIPLQPDKQIQDKKPSRIYKAPVTGVN